MLSTDRRSALLALGIFGLLALAFLSEALPEGRVLVSDESLRRSLPWSAVLDEAPRHNRFVGDQPRLYWPYLQEAARVYQGEADPLWTTRGGGGQPFLGNMSSSLLHPLTLLAAVLPLERVPLVQGVLVLALSAWFTWLFLRRVGVSRGAAAFGALAFGFGGHQVLWLQYALSHTLLALPLCFWAVERLAAVRTRRRLAVLAMGLAMLAFGGHPETGFVAGLVVGLWALYRLWDHHGRWLVVCAGVLALALGALQWWPFLEYATRSTGLTLREVEASRLQGGVSLGASLVFGTFLVGSLALLRASASPGLSRRLIAVVTCVVTLVVARRMGMAVAGGVLAMPQLYGDPVGGGAFTAAQDFPGLNAGYAGVLPPMLLVLAGLVGFGGGYLKFFSVGALLLWGAAFHMPTVESLVRAVPGLSEVGPTRLLGPVGFLAACGGAMFLDRICSKEATSDLLAGAGRVALTLALALGVTFAALRVPVDPHGGRTVVQGLRSPAPQIVHDGHSPILLCFDLERPADNLRILVDGMVLSHGPSGASTPDRPINVTFLPHRMEEGRHRLRVEALRVGEEPDLIADQPLAISRPRQPSGRDLATLSASLLVLGWLLTSRRRHGAWIATAVVAIDVATLGFAYNPSSAADDLYPPTQSVAWLAEQEPPFRIFTEGTILPPDTQFAAGVDHLLSYDNLGYLRTFQLLLEVPIDMDAFASFSFDRDSVAYESQVFDLLDVRYVVTARDTDLSDIPGMTLAHESEVSIWENTDSLGRAFVVGDAVDMEAEDTDYEALRALDLTKVALVQGEVDREALGGSGTARVVAHRGAEIDVELEASGPALLVLAENGAPGWEASVDGGEWSPTRSAYAAWQAVEVPGGSHRVEFRYAPTSVRWGAIVSVGALLVWLFMLGLPRRFS